MNGDENGLHEARDPNAALRELERERKRLVKAGDTAGLTALAQRTAAIDAPTERLRGRRDRLVYGAEQNARYAARAQPEPGGRGLAIGAIVLTVLLAGGLAAVAVFADENTGSSSKTLLANDSPSQRLVRRCDDSDCRFPATIRTVGPGAFVSLGDPAVVSGRYIVADETGKTLGCFDVEYAGGTVVYTQVLSQLDPCPAGTPRNSG
jgi:uncharacterized membrane protein